MDQSRGVSTDQTVFPTAGPLDADAVAILDIPRWTDQLRALPEWREGDRASTMLLRKPPVRVLLSALRSGAELGSDGAEESVLFHVLSGSATISWQGEEARLGTSELALVPKGGGWRITSGASETLLLSTFWGTPGTAQADERTGAPLGAASPGA
jgi:hypothetical protein